MELYLIRHGIAEDRAKYNLDQDRPLTEQGIQKTNQIAQRLNHLGVQFDLILTSPLLRAKQTAQIIQRAGLSQKIEVFRPLTPEGNFQDWLNWWLNSLYNNENSKLALVGHQPNLGNWAETLLWGSQTNNLVVKKAGIIGLNLPKKINPIGNSNLFLLTSPRWFL